MFRYVICIAQHVVLRFFIFYVPFFWCTYVYDLNNT